LIFIIWFLFILFLFFINLFFFNFIPYHLILFNFYTKFGPYSFKCYLFIIFFLIEFSFQIHFLIFDFNLF
jgi:hypothetical protein